MKYLPFVFTAFLFISAGYVLKVIDIQQSSDTPDTWSAFVYSSGYNAGIYDKTDNFTDYSSCKAFAEQQSTTLGNIAWQCGLNCWFDSSHQGYQCAKMKNH